MAAQGFKAGDGRIKVRPGSFPLAGPNQSAGQSLLSGGDLVGLPMGRGNLECLASVAQGGFVMVLFRPTASPLPR